MQFCLNDWSAEILARDILILYACFAKPNIDPAMLWQLWYSLAMEQQHSDTMCDLMRELIQLAALPTTWSDSAFGRLCVFLTDASRGKVVTAWKHWLDAAENKRRDLAKVSAVNPIPTSFNGRNSCAQRRLKIT
jgi:hypothetical protein